MSKVWAIVGASSIIARAFANEIATDCHELILVGRNIEDIKLTANDISLRHTIKVTTLSVDLTNTKELTTLSNTLKSIKDSLGLYLAHSLTYENNVLSQENIKALIDCNVTATTTLIHSFINECQKPKDLVYLSSVAGDRGREKNSLYGASKKMIEIYIDGLRGAYPQINFITPRLGFIDTKETYGKSGIFYALSVSKLAVVIKHAIKRKKQKAYFPFFWRYIMWIIKAIPAKLFYKLKI